MPRSGTTKQYSALPVRTNRSGVSNHHGQMFQPVVPPLSPDEPVVVGPSAVSVVRQFPGAACASYWSRVRVLRTRCRA